MVSRRRFVLGSGAALAAQAVLRSTQAAAAAVEPVPQSLTRGALAPGKPGTDYRPVVVPNGTTLPFEIVGGAKVFHLTAEPITHEMCPGLTIEAWGYNGRTPGPVIEAVEGDHVRIYVTNKLAEPTTIHWHGLIVPNGMDGVSGLTQPPIAPGQTFRYEFVLRQAGTFMYHPHVDEMTQFAMGMMGMIVVHPRRPTGPRPDRDFVLLSSEWFIEPGTRRPDPMAMNDFNMLTFNSKAFPGTEPLVAKLGDRVRIRLGNLSAMDHHPIHLHGFAFHVTGTDGGPIPAAGQWPENSVLVPVGTARTIEFVADNPGDWPMHCHMTHHFMNQMGHERPSLLGVDASRAEKKLAAVAPDFMAMGTTGMSGHAEHMEHMPVPENSVPMKGAPGPFGYIDMGGMFTILKVRAGITSYEDPGWYQHPRGEVASEATADELQRDGITLPKG